VELAVESVLDEPGELPVRPALLDAVQDLGGAIVAQLQSVADLLDERDQLGLLRLVRLRRGPGRRVSLVVDDRPRLGFRDAAIAHQPVHARVFDELGKGTRLRSLRLLDVDLHLLARLA